MTSRSLPLPAAFAILAGICSPGFCLSPELHPPFLIQADGEPIDTEIGHAHPSVTGWDGDGATDLLVGDIQGHVWILKKQGSKGLDFDDKQRLTSGAEPLKVEGDAGPYAVDWNGNGKLDLIARRSPVSIGNCRTYTSSCRGNRKLTASHGCI